MALNNISSIMVASSNFYGNAYNALYAFDKARTEVNSQIKFASKSVQDIKDSLVMSNSIDQLNERKIALKVAEETLATKQELLTKLVATRDEVLDKVHATLDSVDVYEAYTKWVDNPTENNRIGYIKAYTKHIAGIAKIAIDEDVLPVAIIGSYMYWGNSKNNTANSKYCTKSDAKSKFFDMLMRRTIDQLIKDGVIDTFKYTYTSKKLAKMEERIKNYNNECMNK